MIFMITYSLYSVHILELCNGEKKLKSMQGVYLFVCVGAQRVTPVCQSHGSDLMFCLWFI